MTPERFRAIRKQLGLTQEGLAELIGYRRAAQITVIETGKRPVPHLLGLLMEAWAELDNRKR